MSKFKNVIFDIGGIIIDDSNKNLAGLLNISEDEAKDLSKICYGNTFHDCILGNLSLSEHINNSIKKKPERETEIRFILSPKNFHEVIPYFEKNISQIYKLKDEGYNIYFLSNLTKETFDYINSTRSLLKDFCGGVYSFQEHCSKPDKKIYLRLLKQFNLNLAESIFFDDRERNVISAESLGLKSVLFKSFADVINALKL